MRKSDIDAEQVLSFWFEDTTSNIERLEKRGQVWFGGGPDFDRLCADRLGPALEDAADLRLEAWGATPRGRLALVILLDQIPRNVHRASKAAFMHDAQALAHCRAAIESAQDRALHPIERVFLYMPMQHAEDIEIQKLSVERYTLLESEADDSLGFLLEKSTESARIHFDIIERFGRFPHRNRVLERPSTPEEIHFLDDGGPSFGQ
ncbi:DUF924 family protein [Thioalkalivibrio sp. HK1]|uniref:DUF924 family protein n=1 Tax=Thioalkalivibrio sp. HK1 TaxID=1469245 RepID=UPI0006878B3E|nr:DUF924 family protein [Thioalkalivibrio sp. HK1]